MPSTSFIHEKQKLDYYDENFHKISRLEDDLPV
jgi:hypothetical protein